MILKRPDPDIKLMYSGLSHDECHYKGEEFISELERLINKYRIYYSEFEEFQRLENVCRILKKKLDDEERRVE